MAQINNIEITEQFTEIEIGDKVFSLTVEVDIEFHQLDINLNMEYCLHTMIMEIHGQQDIPIILSNWKKSSVLSINEDNRKDVILANQIIDIKAQKKQLSLTIPFKVKLGSYNNHSVYNKKLEAYAVLIPAISYCSMHSNPKSVDLLF